MGIDFDNTNQILLKPEFFAINALETTHKSPINDELILREVKAALLSNKVTKDYKSLLKSGPREFEKSLQDWNYENRLLLYKGKVYIPQSMDNTLRQQIIQIITNSYLLVCDLQEWSSKGSKMRSSLATKDVVKSEV